MGQGAKLYASDKTKASFSASDWALLEKLMPQWAGKNVVLVTAADLDPQKTAAGAKPPYSYTQQFKDFLSSLPMRRDPRDPLPSGLDGVFQYAASQKFGSESDSAFENTGIIAAISDPGNTKQIETPAIAGLTGEQTKLLANVPGTSTDWYLAVMAHESGHLSTLQKDAQSVQYQHDATADAERRRQNAEETRADSNGLTNYFNLCARQTGFNSQVPQAYVELRAIGTLRNTGDTLSNLSLNMSDHDTNAALTVTGNSVQIRPDITAGDIGAAVISINTKTDLLLGMELSTPEMAEKGRKRLDEILSWPELNSPADAAKTARDIGQDRFDLFKKLQQDPDGKQATRTMITGKQIATDNPLVQYAAVRFLYDSGEFKTDQEKLVAKQYLDAFEKYIPSAKGPETKAMIAQFERNRDKTKEATNNLPGIQYVQNSLDISRNQLAETKDDPANNSAAGGDILSGMMASLTSASGPLGSIVKMLSGVLEKIVSFFEDLLSGKMSGVSSDPRQPVISGLIPDAKIGQDGIVQTSNEATQPAADAANLPQQRPGRNS